jgi:hypothetical protein
MTRCTANQHWTIPWQVATQRWTIPWQVTTDWLTLDWLTLDWLTLSTMTISQGAQPMLSTTLCTGVPLIWMRQAAI